MTDLDSALDQAYEKATDVFKPRREFPIGWIYLHRLDGRQKLARRLKADDRFDVRSANNSIRGPIGTHVRINGVDCQSLPAKEEAYNAFLRKLQELGYADGVGVYTRLD